MFDERKEMLVMLPTYLPKVCNHTKIVICLRGVSTLLLILGQRSFQSITGAGLTARFASGRQVFCLQTSKCVCQDNHNEEDCQIRQPLYCISWLGVCVLLKHWSDVLYSQITMSSLSGCSTSQPLMQNAKSM